MEQFTDQPFSDAVARTEYEKRNTELREQIDEAEANRDFGRLEKLKEEQRAFAEEISRAVNLYGRERDFPSPAKNQVRAMRRAIVRAIERLRPNLPNLADHLNNSIARDCFAYRPGPTPPSWVLSENASAG